MINCKRGQPLTSCHAKTITGVAGKSKANGDSESQVLEITNPKKNAKTQTHHGANSNARSK